MARIMISPRDRLWDLRDACLQAKETWTQNSREKALRFPTGIFQTQKLEVVCTKVKDFADLSAMAVSVMPMLNCAKSLYHLKTA